MIPIEAQACLDKLADSFPKWERSDADTKNWLKLLSRLDEAIALRAIAGYWEECRTYSPSPRGFRDIYARLALASQAARPPQEDRQGFSGCFVQCYEAPAGKDGYLGWSIPLMYGRDSSVPPQHILEQHAAATAQRYADSYGGRWHILYGSSWAGSIALRCQLRAEADGA